MWWALLCEAPLKAVGADAQRSVLAVVPFMRFMVVGLKALVCRHSRDVAHEVVTCLDWEGHANASLAFTVRP